MFDLKKIQEKKEELSTRLSSIQPKEVQQEFDVYACSCSGTCYGSCDDTCEGKCIGCGKS
jgi:modification target Cys-rich repeat protein